jgi:hypothetical protein
MLFNGCPVAVPISKTFFIVWVDYYALSPILLYVALKNMIIKIDYFVKNSE